MTTVQAEPSRLSLYDRDDAVRAVLAGEDEETARLVLSCRAIRVAPGEEDVIDRLLSIREVHGLWLTDGLVVRTTQLGPVLLPELLGAGAVLTRAPMPGGPPGLALHRTVVEPTTLLILGNRFAQAIGRWPGLLGLLLERYGEQVRAASAVGALLQLPHVEDRLLVLLSLLVPTWGSEEPEGTVLPLDLTHEVLGRFVGARRPTVTIAVGVLVEAGYLERRPDRSWLLTPAFFEKVAAITSEAPRGPVAGRVRHTDRARMAQASDAVRRSMELRDESQALRAQADQLSRRAQRDR